MPPSDPPLVSIVTPSYNMARFLPETMRSVLSQDYPRIEYIVADGGSTDGTVELLQHFGGRLTYFSGPDQGPSDGIHRGFLRAAGEVFAWIGADDVYLPGAIRTGAEFLAANPQVDVVYGEGYWIDEQGKVIRRYPTLPFDPRRLQRECFISQPTAFIRASAYRRCGLDPSLKLTFDYDLWIRMAKEGLRFAWIPKYLACTRMHASTLSLGRRGEVLRACMELLKRHYGYVPLQWVFGYTTYCIDGRDQFFDQLQPSVHKYLASLPEGFRYNPGCRLRFLGEWMSAPLAAIARRIRTSTGRSRADSSCMR